MVSFLNQVSHKECLGLEMLKKLSIIVAVNIILILFFVYGAYSIGAEFNGYPDSLYYIHWSPFLIQYNLAGSFVNGNWVAVGALGDIINLPFLLFFASTAVNLFFIALLLRRKEQKNC
jgi:hypothetical protein